MRLISDDVLAIATILQEAESEPYEGKLAVAEVIALRTKQKYASDGTVAGTVLWPMQFSGWNAKAKNRIRTVKANLNDPVVAECAKAWDEAKTGKTNVSCGALLYYNPKIVTTPPLWATPAKSRQVATVGNHVFFSPKV